jgi:hypothetical protein
MMICVDWLNVLTFCGPEGALQAPRCARGQGAQYLCSSSRLGARNLQP